MTTLDQAIDNAARWEQACTIEELRTPEFRTAVAAIMERLCDELAQVVELRAAYRRMALKAHAAYYDTHYHDGRTPPSDPNGQVFDTWATSFSSRADQALRQARADHAGAIAATRTQFLAARLTSVAEGCRDELPFE